ncbi:Hypothetical Protein FCC1311_083962 [Hondaea fermentalgiana]|uniref:Uncharacterized protein n=1 Tax=Hondaea fermentalgiana TaxID=2315210 RepID=A0A2R5GUV1_9STRA|nr:Hypothetical Protein FCC1311_083962 [Hondaea fermentalgiana]|eukprot:GBG32171.1 Hypothetical Protein FCC1311_083962 [Hondaea fermentalgiana]
MSFQEKDFVACTVEPYFVKNRKRLFKELEGYYPGEAVQCDEIGFDWIATSLRRILVVVKDTCLDAAIKDVLSADYQVDLVRTVEGAKEKLAEHIYAAVLVASDSVAASALAAQRMISGTEGRSVRPHFKLIRFGDEELDDDGEFDVHRPADLQSVLLDAFFEPTARLAVAFAKLPRMSPHLAA